MDLARVSDRVSVSDSDLDVDLARVSDRVSDSDRGWLVVAGPNATYIICAATLLFVLHGIEKLPALKVGKSACASIVEDAPAVPRVAILAVECTSLTTVKPEASRS